MPLSKVADSGQQQGVVKELNREPRELRRRVKHDEHLITLTRQPSISSVAHKEKRNGRNSIAKGLSRCATAHEWRSKSASGRWLVTDRVHPNDAGMNRITENVVVALKTILTTLPR